jgi:mannosyltransferase OCH1-like enzyme/uncharacterized protein (DUF1919 family)
MGKMTFAYITNNCGNLSFYFDEEREYDHPFIGSLFINDSQFLRLCQNFEHYLKVVPQFGLPSEKSVWFNQNCGGWYKHEEITPPYPVMYLDDLEIHWIHETNEEELLSKFTRRTQRYFEHKPTPVFLWSDADLMNDHSKKDLFDMVNTFVQIPYSIYLSKYKELVHKNERVFLMREWVGKDNKRNESHVPLIHTVGDRVSEYKNILRNLPFKQRPNLYCHCPRKDIPISNPYQLGYKINGHVCTYKGDYTVNVYYVSERECDVRICRHDETHGWGFLQMIFIETGEQIELGSSISNHKQFRVKTVTNLRKVIFQTQEIPKKIIQTMETNVCTNDYTLNAQRSIIESNPEYEYFFFTAEHRRQFIKENFPRILKVYDTLVSGAYQADLFRYCYLYTRGGCYLDFKMIERVPLRDIIKETDEFLVCVDYELSNSHDRSIGTSYLNSIILTKPGNPLLLSMISACVDNIINHQQRFLQESMKGSCTSILDITGPTLFWKCLHEKVSERNLRFKHKITGNDESQYENFTVYDLESKQDIFTKTHKTYSYFNHYSILWYKQQLFYHNFKQCGDWYIYVYPHPYQDSYSFNIIGDHTLRVIRSVNEGWWNKLRVKLINNLTSKTYIVDVGRNNTGTKDVNLPNIFKSSILPSNVFKSEQLRIEDLKLKSVVVGVPSVIHVSDNPILEFSSRSVFTSKERYTQTVEQLKSIREKIPNSTVILLESSTLTQAEINEMSSLYDYVVLYDDEESYQYCHFNYSNKGLGEMYVLCHICSVLQHNKDFKHFCKFGGRYPATKDFNITPFLQDVPVAHVIEGGGKLQTSKGVVNSLAYCVFYSIPRKYLELYYHHFKVWLDPETTEPVEHIFTMFLQALRRVELVDRLNIEGYGATNGNYILL